MKKILMLFMLLSAMYTFAQKRVKVACVGNSITYGFTLPERETQSYPAQLQQMLGDSYEVGNFGKSGATLLAQGHRPYIQQEEYKQALAFGGDIVVIHLGVNDTDPRNWPNYRDSFVRDYLNLIDDFRRVKPDCRILIARLTPILHQHPRYESGTRDWRDEIQLAIETVADVAGVQLIDFESPFSAYPFLLPDAIHPNPEGALKLAQTVYSAITGDFGGLRMPMIYTSHMVLQRDCPLTIHGQADAGAKVTVSIARQKQTTKADGNGKWSVTLLPLVVGGPYTLSVTDGNRTLQYTDVLVGEVWLCSGQSNMEFYLRDAVTASADIPTANNNSIRLFDMKARWRTDAVEWERSVLDSLNHLQYYTDAQWETVTPQTVADFSAIAYYFGKMLQDSLQVPVGLICNAIGGSPTEAWIDRSTLEHQFPDILRNWMSNDFIQDWVRGRAALNIKKSEAKGQRHPYEPCYLFEAGIQPLEQFPVKGVIWYQGESNAHNMTTHERLFRLLVESWRKNWNNDALPFYYVQLSSLNRPSWCWFRDSQRRLMQEIPGMGMVVSSDKGDSLDVHPKDKKPIGERLARWALNRTYGKTQLTPSGPLFRSAEFCEGAGYVTFDYAEGMHSSDGKALRTFEVAEIEGLYHPAIAKVIDNRVEIYSPVVKNPRYVRYGWQPFTRANLVNADGLPASTFRAEAPARDIEATEICPMQGFPKTDKDFAKGVSACFAGMVDGQLLIAGGCNFPHVPVQDGGSKVYYKDIYITDLPTDSVFHWRKAGRLPRPIAYGVSIPTADGLVCVGGMNEQGALSDAYRLRIENKKVRIETLPSLPCTLDNMSGCLLGHTIYLVGGHQNGVPSNVLYSLNLERLSDGWQELPPFPGRPRVQSACAAQLDENGQPALYLWGGFAAASNGRSPSVEVDGCKYTPATNEWTPLSAPDNKGESVSLGGGAAVAWGDSLILCAGGVHKDIFLGGLNNTPSDYLNHPAEWYRFNDLVLAYNTRTQQWKNVVCTPYTARAGASLVIAYPYVFCINGELKPGVRTPEITRIRLEE
ncbi:MAG: cyclically-permuted mutarotase family protein [Bacteroides sp.]|nr:cyclically-permuted mutarotase family protein [Bacteroides sp.]